MKEKMKSYKKISKFGVFGARAAKLMLVAGGLLAMSEGFAFAQKAPDAGAVLAAFADNTVLPTYAKMSDAAVKLDKLVSSMKANPTDEKIAEAAELWKQVRQEWELSEAYLFGPAAFANLDPKLDSWPLDQAQLDKILKLADAGSLNVDAAYVRNYLGAALRGFHAVEYLLFRDGKPRSAKDITPGEMAYLSAAVRVVAEDSIALQAWWAGTDALGKEKAAYLEEAEIEVGGPYAKEVKNAGKAGSRYESQGEAIEEIIQGCVDIADELAESKLGGPVKSGDPKEFESWYSFSSREDCRNNVLSIRYSYEGVNSDGNSVSALVAAKSKEADAAVRSAIEKALKSFDAFSAPLSKSLSDKESFKAAISACSELSQSLQKAQEVLK